MPDAAFILFRFFFGYLFTHEALTGLCKGLFAGFHGSLLVGRRILDRILCFCPVWSTFGDFCFRGPCKFI